MPEWSEHAIILTNRPHGEQAALLTLLTERQGRHAGLVHGGRSSKQRGNLQPGNWVEASWRARLSEQLGHFRCEIVTSWPAFFFHDPLRLLAVTAATQLADRALAERHPYPRLYRALCELLQTLKQEPDILTWGGAYVSWECLLLAELGYGMDLSSCALTGAVEDLAYISPKTGRAAARAAAAPWAERLLALPGFMIKKGPPGNFRELQDGLYLTGFFLQRYVSLRSASARDEGTVLPAARQQLATAIQKKRTASIGA